MITTWKSKKTGLQSSSTTGLGCFDFSTGTAPFLSEGLCRTHLFLSLPLGALHSSRIALCRYRPLVGPLHMHISREGSRVISRGGNGQSQVQQSRKIRPHCRISVSQFETGLEKIGFCASVWKHTRHWSLDRFLLQDREGEEKIDYYYFASLEDRGGD